MARLREDDIRRVQQNADITEVISQYIAIEKKGRNFVALCPFHDDNNPSLTISPEKQIYKCFVCGAGGNVFTFVSNYKNISFVESVIEVAKIVNVDIDVIESNFKPKIDEKLLNYYNIMSDASSFLNFKLLNNQDELLFNYLNNRNLNEDVINYFNIGFESDNSLVEFLSKKGHSNEDLNQINLINTNNYGTFSVFNNRLLFPISNKDGYHVGFSGRIIVDDKNQAKYINSNENVIYTKGDILYNFHRAKDDARREKEVYLVEGVMDVIGFYQAGIKNVVATLGTALTENQAALLKQLSNHVVLSFDNDDAGKLATAKAIKLLLKYKINIEILNGFEDLDPDEYLKVYNKEKFTEAVKNRLSYLDFLLRYYQNHYNLDNYEDRKTFSKTLINFSDYINNEFDKTYFIKEIEKLTGFSANQIVQLKDEKVETKTVSKKVVRRVAPMSRSESMLIGQMLSGKEAALYIRDNLGFLVDENLNKLYLNIIDYYFNNDEMVVADLISSVSNNDLKVAEILLSIINNNTIIKEYDKDIIDESISLIQVKLIDEKISELRNFKTIDDSEKALALKEITELYLQRSKLLGK